MLITIDGRHDAGKSSQRIFLCNHYQLPNGYKVMTDKQKQVKEICLFLKSIRNKQTKLLGRLATLLVRTAYAQIVDEYWLPILNYKTDDKLIDLCLALLPVPDISFYIKISQTESLLRNTEFPKSYFESQAYLEKKITLFKEQDEQQDIFLDWMSKRIPNFVILDGAVPINELTTQMIRIIDNHAKEL